MKERLTYANVLATIAIFVALGGTSYAVATIDGSDVENGSLTGQDIENSSLEGRDVDNNAIKSADIARNTLDGGDIDEQGLGTVPEAETVDGTEVDTSPIHRVATGQSSVLLRQGPFTFTGACESSGEQVRAWGYVTFSEPGEFQAGTTSPDTTPVSAGTRRLALTSHPETWSTQPFSAVSASGARALGMIGSGVEVFGADCAFSILSLGGDTG